jgi:hypothetical protein
VAATGDGFGDAFGVDFVHLGLFVGEGGGAALKRLDIFYLDRITSNQVFYRRLSGS